MKTYKDLRVWKYGYELSLDLHRETRRFPADERFELARDLRKTSRSVIYNIGEGAGRRTIREQMNFLSISAGSTSELEIQLMLSGDLGYIRPFDADRYLQTVTNIRRMLHGMMATLRQETRGRGSSRETGKQTRKPEAGSRTPKRSPATPPAAR